jgi:hypothetical protein
MKFEVLADFCSFSRVGMRISVRARRSLAEYVRVFCDGLREALPVAVGDVTLVHFLLERSCIGLCRHRLGLGRLS